VNGCGPSAFGLRTPGSPPAANPGGRRRLADPQPAPRPAPRKPVLNQPDHADAQIARIRPRHAVPQQHLWPHSRSSHYIWESPPPQNFESTQLETALDRLGRSLSHLKHYHNSATQPQTYSRACGAKATPHADHFRSFRSSQEVLPLGIGTSPEAQLLLLNLYGVFFTLKIFRPKYRNPRLRQWCYAPGAARPVRNT
jgi:hypothetical protein